MKLNSMDIINQMRETREKLAKGEITVDQAQGEARLYHGIIKAMGITLEHARATERLKKGSPSLPAFEMED
jgi:hypothetical protein